MYILNTAVYTALEILPKGIRQKEELKLSLLIDDMIWYVVRKLLQLTNEFKKLQDIRSYKINI